MSLEYPDLNILQTNCSNSRQNEFLLNFTSLLFCYIFEAGKVNSEKREEYFENIICRERNIGRKNQIGKILSQRQKYRKGSYEKDLRAKIFRRKFFEKLFYKLSEILKR